MQGIAAMGKDWSKVRKYKEYFHQVGFVDVVEEKYEWPLGTWAKGKREKMLGRWYKEDALNGLHAATVAVLTRGLKMSVEEVELLLVDVRNDFNSNKIHVYMPV